MPERARHPNKLIQKFFHATGVSWIRDLAGRRVEKLSGGGEIDIPKNGNQAELAQHREQLSIIRAPPKGPAETPQTPTAL